MPLDATTLWVGVSLLIAAFVKGTTGLGFPMIATPTVALLLDIRTAVTILLIPNIVMDITQALRGSFPTAVLRRFAWLILLTIIGVFLGTRLLVILPLWVLNLSLGIMVLTFVASNLLRLNFQIPPRLEGALSPVVGVIGGFLNGMTNASGPALAIYLYSLKLPKKEFIKSIATIFIVTKMSQLVAVSTWNLFTAALVARGHGFHFGGILRWPKDPGSHQPENLQPRAADLPFCCRCHSDHSLLGLGAQAC